MGTSRYSPEGLPPEDFPLNMRYRINALYKLALSSFHAGNYDDTLKFMLKALEKNPENLEILSLLDRVLKRVPEADTAPFQKYLEKRELQDDEDNGGERAADLEAMEQAKEAADRLSASDGPVKVLSPRVVKPVRVKGGKVSDSIQELAQKAKYNPPPEVSDLFDFDDKKDSAKVKVMAPKEVAGETSREKHTRRTASVIEKLRAGRSGGGRENNSELHTQITLQLNQFKAEGFLVSRVEQMLKDRNVDSKRLLDELILLSSQIEMLKELKKRADVLEATPGVNKAKLMTLKLRLSDPDRVSEIIQVIEQMEAATKGLVDQ